MRNDEGFGDSLPDFLALDCMTLLPHWGCNFGTVRRFPTSFTGHAEHEDSSTRADFTVQIFPALKLKGWHRTRERLGQPQAEHHLRVSDAQTVDRPLLRGYQDLNGLARYGAFSIYVAEDLHQLHR